MTIHEAAARAGVTVRALRHYDRLGLLRPAGTTEAGYRLYGEKELQRLWRLLFYRELGFPLQQIGPLLDAPLPDPQALRERRALLLMERDRLDRLLGLVDAAMKGEITMDFTPFDKKEAEAYREEARERWGATEAYKESERRAKKRGPGGDGQIMEELSAVFARFARAMDGLDDADACVEALREMIDRTMYPCPPAVLRQVAALYTDDARFQKNIDRTRPGLAAFVREAVERKYPAE